MGSSLGTIGEIEVINRIGAEELSVEWLIPDFLGLPSVGSDNYASPPFEFCKGRWLFRVFPKRTSTARDQPESGQVDLGLRRCDRGPIGTFNVAVGIQGSEGVEKRREVERTFAGDGWYYDWDEFCSRSELVKQKSRLLPRGALTIMCVLRRVEPVREVKALPKTKQSAEKQGEPPADVLAIYSYKELQTATQNFCDKPLRAGGCKIGEGGFGTVYRAVIRGDVFAVKKLKEPVDKQFISELKTLTNYKHKNLVPLLGCSLGPDCCLLYEYMLNGSLEDRLACKDQSRPLSWQTRLSISYASALGINHLHTFGENPVVHRDIKSANILLDQSFVPKVGDFGLVRTGSSGGSTTTPVTEICCGTRGYMPREALLGDVSVKWDTFSFGVVLLELLTGLPPYDPNRQDKFLIAHMENCKDILPRLDPKAEWIKKAATELYKIARKRCLVESKKSRPAISEILEDLRKLSLLC